MKYLYLLLLFITLCIPSSLWGWGAQPAIMGGSVVSACGASIFEDNFNRGDSATVGGSWTAETDTGNLLAISSNAMVFTQTATTDSNVRYTHGSDVLDAWIQFTVKFSNTTMGGSEQSRWLFWIVDSGGSNTSFHLRAHTNTSGVVTGLSAAVYQDSGWYIFSTYTWNPVAGTTYTIKVHLKNGNGDGICNVYIDGTPVLTKTDFVFTTAQCGDIRNFYLGNIMNYWTDTSGKTTTYDDFELRTDDCFT